MEVDRQRPLLIVDDDEGIRELMSEILTTVGYVPQVAASYDEAIAAARREPPLLAIIDVELPGRSGYELFQALREDFDGIPVIFVSGVRTEPTDRVAGLLAGGDDFLPKPFDPDELVARVHAVLRRTSAE